MTKHHSYDPGEGHQLPHSPIKAIIAPRPIGWISTVDGNGVANLAPYSFFNIVSESPPILLFSSEGRKDTLRNIETSREFVFNLVTRDQMDAMNLTSASWPSGADEFEEAGLGKIQSEVVRPPRVSGSPASMECKLLDVYPFVDLSGQEVHATVVIGQVVRVHIDKGFLVHGQFDIGKAGTVARAGYRGDYVAVTETFELPRPSEL